MNAAIDPWMITSREKVKYQDQFKALQPQNGIVTGAQAKGFFLQSQLPPLILGQIWALADTDSDGKMNINEFSIACKLINLKLRGLEIPKVLPPTMMASLSSAAGTPILTPTGSLSPLDPLKSLGNSIGPMGGPMTLPQPPMSMPQGIVPPLISGAPMIPSMAVQGHSIMPQVAPLIPSAQPLMGNLTNTDQSIIPPQAQIPMARPPLIPSTQPLVSMAPLIPPLTGGIAPIIPGSEPTISGQLSSISGIPAIPPVGMTVHSTVQSVADASKMISPPTADIGSVLPAPPTPPQSNPPSRHMSVSERAPSIESPLTEWAIKGPTKLKYTQLFNTTDRTRSGYLTGAQARNLMVQTKLPQVTLAQIWALADMDLDGRLGCEEFVLAMYLCDQALIGEKIPSTLPTDLVPPSFRKVTSRHGSVSGSRHGSVSGSRHASISSQGAVIEADPAAGLPQTTFEDKRKENFDKGQAELDRRRKLLMDQQRKEIEERERKEREEAEKKEKARLEAERKQQEELERQLQRQREIEMEKEEQRKRALEAKDAARKELERQRQLEWEKQRIQEMQQQRQREQEKVLKLKAQNQTLNIELSTLNEKIKELSQKICNTRAGVSNVKSVIDGMRSTRDTQMSEMAQLKARIKEQNQKLLQLTQEKAKWDAKIKMSQSADNANQEQMTATFSNKQIIIKQLKDKLDNIREEIESKNVDINSNDIQLTDIKAELQDLINKCEELHKTYDVHRNQVLEIKNNRKNESFSSAWDNPSNDWPVDTAAPIDNSAVAAASPVTTTATVTESDPAPEGYVKYRAIYEFMARNADEITFNPGDIVLVPLEQNAEPGWLAGEINGHTGWFPETYVEKIEDSFSNQDSNYNTQDIFIDNNRQLDEISEVVEPTIDNEIVAPEEADITENTITENGVIEYYIAAYPYDSPEIGDLNFSAGEMIMVTKKEGDWWTGTVGNRVGIFPSNYVQKADIGSGTSNVETAAPAEPVEPQQNLQIQKQDSTIKESLNGVAQQQIDETIEVPIVCETNEAVINATEQQIAANIPQPNSGDDLKTQQTEDVDPEISQIYTESKNAEQQESYSRPMSRTSSMTPGMRGKKGEIAQVLAPYEATSAEQLSLQRGQLIMVRKKTDSGWWEGELQAKGRRRQIGWFPASYVKILQGGRNSGRNTPVSASKIELTETILDKVIALYAYKAQNDDELSFEKDDIISVLGRDEPEWWRGELNGLTGLFPSNYVGPFVSSGNV